MRSMASYSGDVKRSSHSDAQSVIGEKARDTYLYIFVSILTVPIQTASLVMPRVVNVEHVNHQPKARERLYTARSEFMAANSAGSNNTRSPEALISRRVVPKPQVGRGEECGVDQPRN